jgi:hypothetical protein
MSGQCGLNPLSLALWDLLSKQFLAARPEEKAFVGHAARQDRTAQYRQEQHEDEHQAMNPDDLLPHAVATPASPAEQSKPSTKSRFSFLKLTPSQTLGLD